VRYSGVHASAVVGGLLLVVACNDRDISTPVPGAGAAPSFGGGAGTAGSFAAGATGGFGAVGGTGGSGASAGFGAVAGAVALPTDPSANGAPLASGAAPNEYAPENCTATYGFGAACVQYFVCERSCTSAAGCSNGQSGTPNVLCLAGPFPSPTCVLGCGDGAVCPNGMQCVVTGNSTLDSICLWPDYLLRQGCPGW